MRGPRPVLRALPSTLASLALVVACKPHAAPATKRERGERDEHHEHRHVNRPTSAASRRRIAELAARELARERARGAPAHAWTALGPFAGNTVDSTGVETTAESGLVEAIRIDPRNPDIVFIATAGGGLWRTTDVTAATPDWHAVTDGLGNLAIGSFDIDVEQPDTIVVGLGEPFYEPGGFVQITRDGGQTFGAPVQLGTASNVRDVRIDPTDSQLILVATDAGLFRSTDGGASFSPIDLPNGAVVLAEAAWTLAFTGRDATGSHWVISAVTACDVGLAPPQESTGLPPGPSCKRGNTGGIWRSSDSGATWTASPLPTLHGSAGLVSVAGRISLAASDPSNPAATVVYAMVANRDERASQTLDILRSNDGGATFVSAASTLTNPDTVCTSFDIGASQSGYNQAIAVDRAHPDHVVVAGLFCSVRSIDATSATPTWQVISDVYGPVTRTACGAIPYVHSDLHAALITPAGRLLLGGDGGLDATDDAFTIATGNECATRWINANHGLATQMAYTIASGDPAAGDGDVIYMGLQDLSSRWRDPANPDRWNTINLSDGTGGAVVRDGDQTIYWAAQVSVAGYTMDRAYCRRSSSVDCGQLGAWTYVNPTLPAGDTEAFVTNLAALPAEHGVLSHSYYHVWKADSTPAWTDISGQRCEPDGTCTTGGFGPAYYINNVTGSPTAAGVYGVALFDHFAVTSDGGGTWTVSAPLGLGGGLLGYAPGSIALPPGGSGDIYVAGSASELLADGSVVPDGVGHLFITHDRGATWSSLAGSGTGALPNVPVWQVKYDPRDATAATIVAATELGVYETTDGGASWTRFGSGLPMVRTTDFALASDDSFLRVATWGRGAWQLDLVDAAQGDGPPSGPPAHGAGCGCRSSSSDASWLLALGVVLARRRRRAARADGGSHRG